MTCVNDTRFLLPAWGVSLTLHGIAVVLAVLFAAEVRPIVQEEPFKWDVAFVETAKTESAAEATPEPSPVPAEKIVPRPVEAPRVVARRPVEPPPDAVMHRVAPQQTAQMVHPEIQPLKPVEPREEPPPTPKVEPPAPVAKLLEEKSFEPVESQVVEIPKTSPEPVMPAKEPEPVIAQRQPVAPPPTEAVESRPLETPIPSAPAPVASSPHTDSAPPVNPDPQEAPIQTAKESPGPVAHDAPVQNAKADHRWLLESLHRRVSELQRYPSSARLNGQEGKVVLKAVIRSDGHLAEVSVQKSSGHQALDAAAIEVVKLACPLHMKHAMGKPQIVVSLPIVYSLTN